MYAHYAFYIANWSGLVPEEKFNFYSTQAVRTMDYLTFDTLVEYSYDFANVPRNVSLCQCELVDYYFKLDTAIEEGRAGPTRRESVDQYTLEFEVSSDRNATLKREMEIQICRQWLTQGPVNYMYVGGRT